MLTALLPLLGSIFGQVTKNLFPDPADELRRLELQNQLQLAVLARSAELDRAAGEVVRTEAASSHWLAANWRPLLMLFFAALIAARWFGWTAPGISEAEYLRLWAIIELGIGGYVIGRTAEKIVPPVAQAAAAAASGKRGWINPDTGRQMWSTTQ